MTKYVILLFHLFVFINFSISQIVSPPPQKKLVEYGWDRVSPEFLLHNFEIVEEKPFDGVGIQLPKEAGGGNIFLIEQWHAVTEEQKQRQLDMLAALPESDKITDNFIMLYGASDMDWFSDEQWRHVEEQLRYLARCAAAGKCKGLFWDAESYGGINPWQYPIQFRKDEFSYEEYYQQVRQCGARFITVLQEEFPGLILLSMRQLSDFQSGSPFSQFVLPVTDRQRALEQLGSAWWGLHLPFTIGILDAIAPTSRFIDANEEAYYYTSALEYYTIYFTLKSDARALVPAELHPKFACQYEIGHAISTDYCAGNWLGLNSFPFRLSGQGTVLTPDQRATWFEHNVYYAMRTADEYCWLYSEDMSWWTGENIPAGFEDAIHRARKKIQSGENLGFSIESMMQNAREKAALLKQD